LKDVKFIVVLAAGFTGNASRLVELRLDDDTMARLVEGVRVSKVLHGCKLVLSGGPSPDGLTSIAQVMAQVAEELGVDRRDMVLDEQSVDTESEALEVASVVGKHPPCSSMTPNASYGAVLSITGSTSSATDASVDLPLGPQGRGVTLCASLACAFETSGFSFTKLDVRTSGFVRGTKGGRARRQRWQRLQPMPAACGFHQD
jgi:hypothetical protein